MVNRRIVVIDDELSVREVARAYLERDGFTVHVAADGREGLALAERTNPALVVLDLMLPDIAGEDVCREIRKRSDVAILMLSAKASVDDRVGGLSLGADDYLAKPFSPRELVARVRAVLRRAGDPAAPLVQTMSFDDGRLTIDAVTREVQLDGRVIDLTPTEFTLLLVLARYPGRAYSRFEIANAIQGLDYDGLMRTIDAHVKNLRKKLEPDPRRPRYVETVYGVGYRLAKL